MATTVAAAEAALLPMPIPTGTFFSMTIEILPLVFEPFRMLAATMPATFSRVEWELHALRRSDFDRIAPASKEIRSLSLGFSRATAKMSNPDPGWLRRQGLRQRREYSFPD